MAQCECCNKRMQRVVIQVCYNDDCEVSWYKNWEAYLEDF